MREVNGGALYYLNVISVMLLEILMVGHCIALM